MSYAIKVLKEKASEHFIKISELKNLDHGQYSSMLFVDEMIENHYDCIRSINEAINNLLKLQL